MNHKDPERRTRIQNIVDRATMSHTERRRATKSHNEIE